MGVLHYEVGNMPRLRPMRALCVNLAGIEDPRRDRFGLTGLHTISVDLNLSTKLADRPFAEARFRAKITGQKLRVHSGRAGRARNNQDTKPAAIIIYDNRG